jgi:flagellar protein FlbB
MAEKVKSDNKKNKIDIQPEKPKKKVGKIFKGLLIVLILLIIAAVGFALGIYLKVIDTDALVTKWKLNEYPVVGQYFPQPTTNFEPVELDQQSVGQVPANTATVPSVVSQVPLTPVVEKPKIDDSELLKQEKLKQLENAKRISKTARLYGAMKPDEAVAILNKLDDNTVIDILSKMEEEQVSKIMAALDPGRSADLTQAMLKGKKIN